MDTNQPQGAEEVQAELVDKAQELGERSLSVTERLNQYHAKQPGYGEQPQVESTEQTPEPTPSSNQKQTEAVETTPESVPDQNKLDELPTKEEALLNSKNPERTKAYIEKLEAQLDQERRRAESVTSVFDQPTQTEQQPTVSQFDYLDSNQIGQIQTNFVQPDGTVDIDGLNRALNQANNQARMAAIEVERTRAELRTQNERIAKFEETTQVRDLHEKFPEIDPSQKDRFNPAFFEAVRDRLVLNKLSQRVVPAIKVAEEIKARFQFGSPVNLDKVRVEAVEEYKQNLSKRTQGPIETGHGETRTESTDKQLRDRTRRGDPFALNERLRKAGIIK